MDATRTVGVTERTRDAGRTGGRTEGQTDGRGETNIPPTTSLCGGIITDPIYVKKRRHYTPTLQTTPSNYQDIVYAVQRQEYDTTHKTGHSVP